MFISLGVNILVVVLDLISLSALYPVLILLFQENALVENKFIVFLLDFIHSNFLDQEKIKTSSEIFYLFAYFILIIFSLRTVLGLLANYLQLRIRLKFKMYFTELVLNKFLKKQNNFLYFKSYGEFSRLIDLDIEKMCTIIDVFIIFLLDIGFLIIAVFLLSVLIESVSLVPIICFFLILLFIIPRLVNKLIVKNAENQKIFSEKKTQSSVLIFNTAKEIILYAKQKFFFNNLTKIILNLYRSTVFKTWFNKSFRYIMEFLIFLFVIVFLAFFSSNMDDIKNFLPIISMLFVAFLRMSPIFSRFFTNLSDLRDTSVALNSFIDFMSYKFNQNEYINLLEKDKITNFQNIHILNLNFSYSKEEKIFEDLNLNLKKGNLYALSATSGYGKTTFLSLIMGFLQPNEGKIIFDEKMLTSTAQFGNNLISYVPQKTYIIDENIEFNVTFGQKKENINNKMLEEAYSLAGINSKNFLSLDANFKLGENGSNISGGQIQRISIARAIYQNPQMLILDETLNALDNKSHDMVFNNLLNWINKNRLAIIISHNMPDKYKQQINIIDLKSINKLKNI